MSSFVLYMIGFVLLSAGIIVGADLLGVADRWLWVMGLILLGFGVMVGVAKTRRPDAPAASEPPSEHV